MGLAEFETGRSRSGAAKPPVLIVQRWDATEALQLQPPPPPSGPTHGRRPCCLPAGGR